MSTTTYDVVIARSVKITARDGARLSIDIYRPARNGEALPGPFPAVLTRSPYDTRSGKGPSGQAGNGEYFARRGYLYVVQDSRGRFESEGDFVLLDQDGVDGYDVIEAIAALPYCDGNIGTQGSSLRAWNQNAAALERPPHLKAMWVNQGGWNGLKSALRHNGTFELRWLCWAITQGIHSQQAHADPALQARFVRHGERMFEWLQQLPWQEGKSPLAELPAWEKWLLDLYRNGDDGPFWKNPSRNFELYKDHSADIPTVYAGSWYDSYARSTVENYLMFESRLANQFLLLGGGVHGGPNFDNRMAGDIDLGPEATIKGNLATDRKALMLAFFDRFLKGDQSAFSDQPNVRYFRMGGDGGRNAQGKLLHGGSWFTASTWPPSAANTVDYYLDEGGKLQMSTSAASAAKTSFIFDPQDPLPAVAGNVSSMTQNLPPFPRMMRTGDPISLRHSIVLQGASDQVTHSGVAGAKAPFGDLALRSDVIVFETVPFEQATEVTGTPEVELFVSSDAPDTDIFCMIQDIYPESDIWPDGYRLNLTDSIFRLRYRDGFDAPKLLVKDEVVKLRFPLYPISNLFAKGHRLRLLISSSSFPRFDVNPNTGEALGRHTHLRKAENSIHHDSTHLSRLILPIVGNGEATA